MKNRRLLLYFLTAAALASAVFFLWTQGVFLPSWIEWKKRTYSIQEGEYELTLQKGKAILASSDKLVSSAKRERQEALWASDPKILVQDLLLGDIDRDGEEEVLILCWRRGRYGPAKPDWVKEERTWSQHIYIYDLSPQKGGLRALWMASDIGKEVFSWSLPSEGRLLLSHPDGTRDLWQWRDFGLEYIGDLPARSLQGADSYAIIKAIESLSRGTYC